VIRQAQGSNGWTSPATVAFATDPDVEQGLEGRRRPRRKSTVVYSARKRVGDTVGAACGGKASKGRAASRGSSERSGNVANPRVGSVLQYTRRVLEEQAVEVVENHEDGTRSGGGRPFPKEVTTWSPGVDSGIRFLDGRAVFEGSTEVWWGRLATVGRMRTRATANATRRGRSWSGRRKTRRMWVPVRSYQPPARPRVLEGTVSAARADPPKSTEGRRRSRARQPRGGESRLHP